MSRFRLGSLVAFAAGILITAGGCTDSPAAPAQPGAGLELLRAPEGPRFSRSGTDASSQVIGPEGGVIELFTGDRIVFPAGAVSAPTEIGMRADDTYQGVRLSPHGLTFPASAQPVLELRAVGEGAFRRQLTVVYVDDGDSILEVLPTDRHGNTLRVNLEHFSGYIVAGGRAESTRMP